jgi:hypothetical protein
VITLGTAFVILMTISLAVAIGVGSGFMIISAILNAFAHKPQQTETAAPALVPQGVSGD